MPSTTLGYERLFNWAFQVTDEDEFIRAVLAGQPEAPRYFGRMKYLNRDGATPYSPTPIPSIDAAALAACLANDSTIVIDTRSSPSFGAGFIPGTINIPGGRSFPLWAGSLLSPDHDIVLLAGDEGRAQSLRRELSLIGLDRVVAWTGPEIFDAWCKLRHALECVRTIGAQELAETSDVEIIDVRSASEWNAGHIAGARHVFLGDLTDRIGELPRDRRLVIACQGGSRSSIGGSLLRARGFSHVINFSGGFSEWQEAGLPVETAEATVPSR
jgi:hydroxyacylglutathione hydrolase